MDESGYDPSSRIRMNCQGTQQLTACGFDSGVHPAFLSLICRDSGRKEIKLRFAKLPPPKPGVVETRERTGSANP
jgi:hypothetical protein